jgi:RHH-type rel operon transcriptional repressor/antitoxin RelB
LERLDDFEEVYLAEQRLIAYRAGQSKAISLEDVMREYGMAG